jgi:hypothetical protein
MASVNIVTGNAVPPFCENCEHKIICGIQKSIVEQDKDVSEFNADNSSKLQSITSTAYVCRYKLKTT